MFHVADNYCWFSQAISRERRRCVKT